MAIDIKYKSYKYQNTHNHTKPPFLFFFCFVQVSYYREAVMLPSTTEQKKDTPTHRLVVYDLRGAWTKSNRNVAFALFDTFIKNKQMKKNLSTEALKGFRKDANTTPLKRRNVDVPGTPPNQMHVSLHV